MAPTCPPLQGQAICSSRCPLSAAASGSSSGLVTLAESPEEMTLLGAPVLPPGNSPEHYLPMHSAAHLQPGDPHLQQQHVATHSLPAAGNGCPHMRVGCGCTAAHPYAACAQQGTSAEGPSPAGNASAATRSGYTLLQPTPNGLQRGTPAAARAWCHKRRALSPDAAGLQRLTLGKAQKKLKLEGSDLGLTWQAMSAADSSLRPAASGGPTSAAASQGAMAVSSPTKVGLPQQAAASLKQIKKRRVSLRLQAQSHAAKPPKAPVSIPEDTPTHTHTSPLQGGSTLQASLPAQPLLPLAQSSSGGSAKFKVSDEMAQSPHARGGPIRQSPACGLAQQHGLSGCLYNGFFDQGPHRAQGGERSGECPASLSAGCQALGKRPISGRDVFRSQKRLRF